MKKLMFISLMAVLVASLVLVGCQQTSTTSTSKTTPTTAPTTEADGKVYELTYCTSNVINETGKVAQQWAEEVFEKSDGRLKITVVARGDVGLTGQELPSAVTRGIIDITEGNPGLLGYEYPIALCAQGFWICESWQDARENWRRAMDFITPDVWEPSGLVPITTGTYGTATIYTRGKKVEKIEDFQGLKMRVTGKAFGDLFKNLGATPVDIVMTEVYTALQRDMVDGLNMSFDSTAMYKFQEQLDYLLGPPNCEYAAWVQYTSKEVLDGLPADLREIMLTTAAAYSDIYWERANTADEKGREILLASGMEEVPQSPEFTQQIIEIAKQTSKNIAEEYGPRGVELFNLVYEEN